MFDFDETGDIVLATNLAFDLFILILVSWFGNLWISSLAE